MPRRKYKNSIKSSKSVTKKSAGKISKKRMSAFVQAFRNEEE